MSDTGSASARAAGELLRLLACEREALRRLAWSELEQLALEKERQLHHLATCLQGERSGSLDADERHACARLRLESELNASLVGETLRVLRSHLGLSESGLYDQDARRREHRTPAARRHV